MATKNNIDVYIATDWYRTMVFLAEPRLIENDGRKEWSGIRIHDFERLIPKGFKQRRNTCVKAHVTLEIEE